jgi:hypothetical protein
VIAQPSVAILGGAGTGKTLYGGQLIGRLRQRKSALRLVHAPSERTVFDDVLQRLQEGRTAEHTPTTQYSEEKLPIRNCAGEEIDLVWADYGGEQLDRAVETRLVSRQWQDRLAGAAAWMLFLRLGSLTVYRTDAARLEAVAQKNDAPPPAGWDGNALVIELLQILLHAAHLSTAQPLVGPKLLVALSCWDERAGQRKPRDELWATVPAVAAFLDASWRKDACSVWGLSSLGKALRKDVPDADYVEYGPESFGYVIRPDGERSSDLSEPLEWLIR